MKRMIRVVAAIAGFATSLAVQVPSASAEPVEIRAAHLANVTHAQAVVGRAKNWFEEKLGGDAKVTWKTFNAGPSIIEGIFGNQIDVAYIGPGPAINGYVKSEGEALRIIAGAASGGAAFVVRQGAGILSERDLAGKKVASPQLGNTQDIALRAWLANAGLKSKEKGGTVTVLPIGNADQLTLFQKGQLDAAWTVEPWVSRLVKEGGGAVLFEESSLWPGGKYATTLLIVRKGFLDEHPDIVRKWVSAHVQITIWINANKPEAIQLFNAELAREIGKPLPEDVVQSSFARLEFTTDPLVKSVREDAKAAYDLGFLGRKKPDLKDLFSLYYLQEIAQVSFDIIDKAY